MATIFDSPWFTFERPAFQRIAAQSDPTLTFLLIIAAIAIVYIALNPATPTLLKAVVLAYIVLP
jgi:hypothetical protein